MKSFLIVLLSLAACNSYFEGEYLNRNFAIFSLSDATFLEGKPTRLQREDFPIIEDVLVQSAEDFNEQIKSPAYSSDYRPINLKNYSFQLIPYQNSENETEVWVNAFCDDVGLNMWEQIIVVDDGGECFFNLIINIDEVDYKDVYVNGIA